MNSESHDELCDDAMDTLECGAGPLCPPVLRHQRSSDLRYEESPPMFRSMALPAHGSSSSMVEDEDYDEPVYRSIAGVSALDLGDLAEHYVTDHALDDDYGYPCLMRQPVRQPTSWAHEAGPSAEFKEGPVYRGLPGRASLSALTNSAASCSSDAAPVVVPPASFVFELPPELLDMVLQLLTPWPDLFAAMACSRAWCDAARVNYANRRRTVPATPDALLAAVAGAWPGDTLLVAAGHHMLSSEIAVDKPLRLVGAPGAGPAVLHSTHHVLLRTRCSALVEDLTLLRLGDEVGYPNAVVYAEAGSLTMRGCRITCGGPAPSVEHALRVFHGAPAPGQPWQEPERPDAAGQGDASDDDRGQDPQSGLWVGAAARVHLSRSLILCCQGPGVKIYRGELEGEDNTIAFATRGANVVANGGKVLLVRNEIKGALGDGVSSWNNSQLRLEENRIHANSGAGIAINTGGGAVNITKNLVFDNCCSAVLFATSQTKQVRVVDRQPASSSPACVSPRPRARERTRLGSGEGGAGGPLSTPRAPRPAPWLRTPEGARAHPLLSHVVQATLSGNDLERNAKGGVQGLHQVAGHRFLHQHRRRAGTEQPPHVQRATFAPPPLLPQPAEGPGLPGPSSPSSASLSDSAPSMASMEL